MSDEDRDAAFAAITKAYWEAKYDLDEARIENQDQHFEGTITINKSSLDELNRGTASPTSESRLEQIPQLLSSGAIDIFTNGKHEDP